MAELKDSKIKDDSPVQTPAERARESLSLEGSNRAERKESHKATSPAGHGPEKTSISAVQTQPGSAEKLLPQLKLTDDAAFLKSSLEERDPQRREDKVRFLYRTLNAEHLDKAEAGLAKRDGVTINETLHSRLSDRTIEAIDTYRQAARENRPVTAAERTHLAQLGASSGDRDLIIEAVAGSSKEASRAREILKDDRAFNAGLLRNFKEGTPSSALTAEKLSDPTNRIDPVLRDFLKEGRVKLSTIAEANTGYIFANKENTDLAIEHALPEERLQFKQGYELRHGQHTALTSEQERSLKFYDQLQEKLDRGGNKGDVLRWQDSLLNGKETIVSQLAKTEKDGTFWGSSHSTPEIISAATRLNEHDWHLLRNADHGDGKEKTEGQNFKRQFEQAVDKLAQNPDEAKRIKALVYEKTGRETFDEAQRVALPLDIALKDAQTASPLEERNNTFSAIIRMSQEQAAKYHDDPSVRQQVADQLAQSQPETRPLAERLLQQVEKTGQPPKLEGFDKLEYSSLTGRQLSLAETEELLKNPQVTTRLNRPESQLSADEKQAVRSLNSAFIRGLDSRRTNERPLLSGEAQPGDFIAKQGEANTIRHNLADGGHLSLEQQYRLNVPINEIYKNIASVPRQEQEEFLSKLITSPEQHSIAQAVARQGEVRLEDLARSYSLEGKDAKALSAALEHAGPDAIAKAKSAWAEKYPGDLTTEVLKKANEAESPALRAILSPSADGRQELYDNYQKYLSGRGGLGLDGSGLTLERAAQIHQEAQKAYEQNRQLLPADQQRQLDEFFGKALQDHKDSEIKQTQILLDAAITAATLGTGAPITAAGVAARIAAGGLTEATGTALARGEFKAETFVADFVQGGVSAYAGRAASSAGEKIATKLGNATRETIDETAGLSLTSIKHDTAGSALSDRGKETGRQLKAGEKQLDEAHTRFSGDQGRAARDVVGAHNLESKGLKPFVPVRATGASPEFIEKILSALQALPEDAAKRLKENGISVEVVGNVYKYSKDPAFLDAPIRGQPGKTQRDGAAFFNFETKKIVIIENSPKGDGYWPGEEVKRAVAHELGHPVDTYLVGDVLKKPHFARSAEPGRPMIGHSISDLPEFQKAFFADMKSFSDSLPRLSTKDRDEAVFQIGYHLADRGFHIERLDLKGIGTHSDNPARHNASGIRELGGRHSGGRSEAFADVHSDLLIGDDLFTKYLPNTTRIVRDQVLSLPTVPLHEATPASLQSLGFKFGREKSGHEIFNRGQDVAAFNNGRLKELLLDKEFYRFSYDEQGKVSKIVKSSTETNSRGELKIGETKKTLSLVNGNWQKYEDGVLESTAHPPVLSLIGNNKLKYYDQ